MSTRPNCPPDHPWRQYPNRRERMPTRREVEVAEAMSECDCGAPGCRPKRITAEEIARRLGMKPSNVRNVMAVVRKRLGPQAR